MVDLRGGTRHCRGWTRNTAAARFPLAWAFGIVFQYFTSAPMRGLSFGKGLLQALRADTLSIVAFQIVMSIWAVLVYFVLFTSPHLKFNEAVFWLMMQIGMTVGFLTSYPVNIFLAKSGWKEKMPQGKHEMNEKLWTKKCINNKHGSYEQREITRVVLHRSQRRQD
jgi:hypothetical protein